MKNYEGIELFILLHSPVLPHFLRVPSRFVGEVTFIDQRQRFEFVDKLGVEMDMPFVIYCEHYNDYFYFKDTSKLQPAPLQNLIHLPPKSNMYSQIMIHLWSNCQKISYTCMAKDLHYFQ